MARSPGRLRREVGREVAAHRERRGWSRPELAAKLGIDRTHVWRIEQGETLPSLDLLDSIASLFGVTLNDLRSPRTR